tara:strand:- start:1129 stop:1686 length:558 start_codon:yes stop_codon:yes gene_type:complete
MKNLIKKILKEDNDFDWAKDINPISVEEIQNKIHDRVGYGISNWSSERIAKKAYVLGLLSREVDIFVDILAGISESAHDDGVQSGWEEGHSAGWEEKSSDCEEQEEGIKEESYQEGYEEGYEIGSETSKQEVEGYFEKKMKKEAKLIYKQAFEEGRAYESEMDTEDYERGQSGFDPKDYDGDYEN